MAVAGQDVLLEYFYKSAEAIFKKLILPDAEQAGVGFEDVKVSVHRLALVGILVTESHIFDLVPLAGECFKIAVLFSVEAMVFYRIEQFYGIFQSLSVACGAVEFGESVNGECYRIYLFLRIERSAVRIQRPVGSAIFLIKEPVDEHGFGFLRHFKVLLFTKNPVG